MISIRNLSKSFGDNLIFKDINVDIEDGEVVAVIGPSGCGKSTFIRCINLLEQPDSGQIFIGEQEITKKGWILILFAGNWAWFFNPLACFLIRLYWRMLF